MLSSSPYSAALRTRHTERLARTGGVGGSGGGGGMGVVPGSEPTPPSSLPSPASSPSPGPTPDTLSTTAKLILDTLDKMSTPIQDAKRMPTLIQPRAEKRKLIEEELNCSLKSPQRRRVRLGSGALSLAGPPLRKSYAPVSLTNGLASPLATSASKTPSPQPSPLPVAPPATVFPSATKSSLKLKSKVVDSGRAPPATRSSPPPPAAPAAISQALPLPITSMPIFNLAAPTPVTNGIDRAKNEEKSEKKEKSTLEKEENNNKKCKRPLEEEVENESRKKAATIEPPKQIFEIRPFGGNSDLSGIPKSVTATSKLEAVASPTFTFSRPTTVITQASIVPATFEYHFSSPTAISHQQKAGSVTNSPLPRTPRTVSTQGDRRLAVAQKHHPVASPPKMMFSAMPDVTNNLVRKPHSSDTGAASMQRLPDLGLS